MDGSVTTLGLFALAICCMCDVGNLAGKDNVNSGKGGKYRGRGGFALPSPLRDEDDHDEITLRADVETIPTPVSDFLSAKYDKNLNIPGHRQKKRKSKKRSKRPVIVTEKAELETSTDPNVTDRNLMKASGTETKSIIVPRIPLEISILCVVGAIASMTLFSLAYFKCFRDSSAAHEDEPKEKATKNEKSPGEDAEKNSKKSDEEETNKDEKSPKKKKKAKINVKKKKRR